jgi:hypothetical protein
MRAFLALRAFKAARGDCRSARRPEIRDVDRHEQEELVDLAYACRPRDCGRHLDQLNPLAAIAPDLVRRSREFSAAMGKNRLLLVIASLALLVAIGILTG